MQRRTTRGPHRTAGERAAILAARARSDLTHDEFATQHGIAASTLYRWQREARPLSETARPPAGFVELPCVVSTQPRAAVCRLIFQQGLVLELGAGFPPESLRLLARVIQDL
jgi:transposase-like protein